jgi:hypothetical protein
MPDKNRRERVRGQLKATLEINEALRADLEKLEARFTAYMELEETDHDLLVTLQARVAELESKPFNLDRLNFLGKLLFKIIGK